MDMTPLAMGQAFQHWALGIVAYTGYRSCLERARGAAVDVSKLSLWSEAHAIREGEAGEADIRLDAQFRAGASDLLSECKWTGGPPIKKFRKASRYLHSVKLDSGAADFLIVVGSATKRLAQTAVAKALRDAKHDYRLEWGYQLQRSGTGVWRYVSGKKTALTVVSVVAEDNLMHACGEALAILLTLPQEREARVDEVQHMIGRLAVSCMVPALRLLHDLPLLQGERLDHSPALKQLFPPGFVLDPWSFLLQLHVDAARGRQPAKHRWVRLLAEAVRTKAEDCGADPRALPGEPGIAARIPPLPLRCGTLQNLNVVRELAHAIPWSPPGPRTHATTIRILAGPAGTGKSTLLEYLYRAHVEQLWRGGAAGPRCGLPVFIDLQRDAAILSSLPEHPDDSACIRAIEALTGNGGASAWSFIGRDRSAPALDTSVLATMFARFQVSLYVDGYDQLDTTGADRLRLLGSWLRAIGCEFTYVLLSSRSGHGELQAFNWQESFSVAGMPSEESVLVLAHPESEEVEQYCAAWLHLLASLLPRADKTAGDLQAQGFIDWLGQTQQQDTAADISSVAVKENPLLLAMALSIYIGELSRTPDFFALKLETRADLYERLIGDYTHASADHDANARAGGDPVRAALRNQPGREAFEKLCFDSLRRPGRTVGRIDRLSLREAGQDDPGHAAFFRALRGLPFVQAARPGAQGSGAIDFVHPSFHEYLAAAFFARQLCKENPGALGDLPFDRHGAVALQRRGEIVTTAFGEIVVGFGRDAFKYLLGCLLADARRNRRAGGESGLVRFFSMLFEDFGLQQYLYDAGFVDACIDELLAAERRLRAGSKAYYCAIKLIGHKYYGSKGQLEHGIAYLVELASQRKAGALLAWYRLFCIDHIQNRLGRLDPDTALAQVRERAQGEEVTDFEVPDDLASWTENKRSEIMGGLPIFADDGLVSDSGRVNMAGVPEPDWTREHLLILRAAHYWGHVGNRDLFSQTSLTQQVGAERELAAKRRRALGAYARAIVYRAVSMVWSAGPGLTAQLLEALSTKRSFPSWFVDWAARVPETELTAFERFVGPAQALGDIANQYFCLADVLLWEAVCAGSPAQRATALNDAHSHQAVADRLWILARSEPVRTAQGENVLRYFILGAGVDERFEIMQDALARHVVPTSAEARARVWARLERLQREYGMHYELGMDDVLMSTEAFRKTVAARVQVLQ